MNDNRNRRIEPTGQGSPGSSQSRPPDSRPPIRRARRRSFVGPTIAALVMTVLVIVAVVVLVMLITERAKLPSGIDSETDLSPESIDTSEVTSLPETSVETEVQTETSVVTEQETDPDTETPAASITGYKTVSLEKQELHKGDLILINYQYEYVFPEKKNTVNIYANKNSSYLLSSSQLELEPRTLDALNAMMLAFHSESGSGDVIVKNAYRSLEEQKSLYDARVSAYGEENANKYLAQPGHSEHHTGMCFDLGIYKEDGKLYELDGVAGYADWFKDNCGKYGFVLRFPENKAAITGITSDRWHFRYVGQVHAETMNELGLCLEEYIDELRKYPYSGDHLLVTTSTGKKYEIYYQYASDAGKTEVYVPENLPYTISGDNALGFIVTVSLSE